MRCSLMFGPAQRLAAAPPYKYANLAASPSPPPSSQTLAASAAVPVPVRERRSPSPSAVPVRERRSPFPSAVPVPVPVSERRRPHPPSLSPSPSPSASAAVLLCRQKPEGYPTMAQKVRIVSSLADVDAALQDLQITEMNQAHLVRFQLDEQAPLQEAAKINVKTHPGRHGFILVNPELLKCKFKAKMALETSFNTMLDASLERNDQEQQGVEASIAALKVLVRYDDNQMAQMAPNGPPLLERNRGVQHAIYPHPPFPVAPSFEHGTTLQQRVPYQPAYGTQQERDEASARDRRAQRAIWHAKLRILEARQSILSGKRSETMSKMRAEFKRIMEEPSDLGAGYADHAYPPLA